MAGRRCTVPLEPIDARIRWLAAAAVSLTIIVYFAVIVYLAAH